VNQSSLLRRLVLAAVFVVAPAGLQAQVADPDATRFEEEIERFASYDSHNFVPHDAVVFVGSSSIRFWSTADRFPSLALVNRGFGGSHVSDVNHFVEETVLKYSPELVVFYAGDNDVGAGKSPQQVFEDYREFTERVLTDLPDAEILFISLKPSIRRWNSWPQMVEVNRLVREFSDGAPNLHYADVATPMLAGQDEPDPAQFVTDGLHLTEYGYDIWTDVVGNAIARVRK
jgi:lysophospholipase L1-like esterase